MQPEKLRRTEEFPRVFRGYAPEEVDAYIAELLEQYEQLYRENREMIQHLRTYAKREAEIKEQKDAADARLEAAAAEAKRIVLRAKADGDIIRERMEKEASERMAEHERELAEAAEKRERFREETAAFVSRVSEEYEVARERLRAIAEDYELPEMPGLFAAEPAIELPEPPLPNDEYDAGDGDDAGIPADSLPEEDVPEETPDGPLSETDEFTRVYGNDNYVKELRRTPRRRK